MEKDHPQSLEENIYNVVIRLRAWPDVLGCHQLAQEVTIAFMDCLAMHDHSIFNVLSLALDGHHDY